LLPKVRALLEPAAAAAVCLHRRRAKYSLQHLVRVNLVGQGKPLRCIFLRAPLVSAAAAAAAVCMYCRRAKYSLQHLVRVNLACCVACLSKAPLCLLFAPCRRA
jgi:hypothetical protein